MAGTAMGSGGFERRRVPPAGLGPALKAARERAGLGLREAARAAEVSGAMLYKLEAGRRCPSAATADGLRRVLELLPDEAAILEAATVAGVGHSHPARRRMTCHEPKPLEPVTRRTPPTQSGG